MKNLLEKLKKVPKKTYLVAGSICLGLIIVITCVVAISTESNKSDVQLKILGKECDIPMTVRMLENIGFTTDDANSEYNLKDGEESVEFKDITYIFQNKYNSKVDLSTIPADDGMVAVVDFVKYKNNREITKITFNAKNNNGEYISINELYLKDMTFDTVTAKFGENYELLSDAQIILLGKKIKYTYEDCDLIFEFTAKKINRITIEFHKGE